MYVHFVFNINNIHVPIIVPLKKICNEIARDRESGEKGGLVFGTRFNEGYNRVRARVRGGRR